MGQLNAVLGQQGQQAAGVITRRTIVAAGAPYAAAEAALTAPVVITGGSEVALSLAARFPGVTTFALDVGNALNGTTLPRAAAGGVLAGTGVAGAVFGEIESNPVATQKTFSALAQELEGGLPPGAPPDLSTEAAALFRARDEAVPVARKLVQQELDAGRVSPGRAQARFGTWLDALAKSGVRQAVQDGQLPPTFVTSPTVAISRGYLRPWIKAPDVWDTATGRAWDFMAQHEAAFYQHEASYLGTVASGRLDPGGTTIGEIFPLFHPGF
jgi:hypothetical protein